jgi:hypothetical protein
MEKFIGLAVVLLTACEGPKGPQGNAGAPGPTGETGPTGSPGAIGAVGNVGATGATGPTGSPGENGDAGVPGQNGQNGDAGAAGCAGLNAGETAGLSVDLQLSTPANGQFFVAGERPVATIRFSNRCGTLRATDLQGSANLYMYGPRNAFAETASKLLNCITDRNAADHQHHFINLKAPKFLDTSVTNLAQAADGTITFTFSPITDETSGTYAVGVWAVTNGDLDQEFALADVQIGTSTVETYSSGPTASSKCFACHRAEGDIYAQMHHIRPGRSPIGNFALDQWPIATCKSCHNVAGYSLNPIVRKVHGLHHGENQPNAGAAHPEYGENNFDSTLVEYKNVGFPSMPGGEKDCARCHADDRFKLKPSRLACGGCHENLFFDTGTFTPARVYGLYGEPILGSCSVNADCSTFGTTAFCDQNTGSAHKGECVFKCTSDNDCLQYGQYTMCDTDSASASFNECIHDLHPIQNDDSQCAVCHNEGQAAIASISKVHDIPQNTSVPGVTLTNVTLARLPSPSPIPGDPAVFQVGDVPTVSFHFADKNGPIVDLKLNSAYSLTALIAGPTDDRQRMYPSLSKTGGALSGGANGDYTFTFPSPIPVAAQLPYNSADPVRDNPPGTYTLWFYIYKSVTVGNQSIRDVANSIVDFKFGDGAMPLRPRRIVTEQACNNCHVDVQAHGGGRKDKVEMCSACHTKGAFDRGLARPDQATGAQCIVGVTVCAAFQTCQTAPAGVAPPKSPNTGYCVLTTDPTPNNSIEFSQLIHNIHFARLREGYNERNFAAPFTGQLVYAAYNNNITDLSEILFPMDIRNCNACHADQKTTCTSDAQCGMGQSCIGAKCLNRAWMEPSARVCLSCHDMADAYGHAALNTWQSPDGPVETCTVCHGEDSEFSVQKVHSIRNPYVPTYQRLPPGGE